jgi:uncharacterized protein YceK
MNRFVLVSCVVLLLAGCATYYSHPTKKSPAEFERDKRSCQRTAEQAAATRRTRVCDEIDRCLLSKGWSR